MDYLEDFQHYDITEKKVITKRFYDFVSPNQMWLFAITDIDFVDGEVVMGRVIFKIDQFWIWHFLYGDGT